MLKRLAAAVAVVGAATPAHAQSFHLLCGGGGTANKTAVTNAYGSNSYGESANATVYSRRTQDFEDHVNVQIEGTEGKIRMPRTMLPMFRGGEDGWFKLKNIEVGEHEITASAAVNIINNPKVRIDRITGAISISGKAGDFSGQCEPYDPATVQKKF